MTQLLLLNDKEMSCAWLKKCRIKANESKSIQITFTLLNESYVTVTLNNTNTQTEYLGILLDRNLSWRSHIFLKRTQIGLQLRLLYWLLGQKSVLPLDNKVLIYQVILKPIWTYGVQIWDSVTKPNLVILQRFQSNELRMCANAPWFVSNEVLHRDLKVSTIYEEIDHISQRYSNRLTPHPNLRANNLLGTNFASYRFEKCMPFNLVQRFQGVK